MAKHVNTLALRNADSIEQAVALYHAGRLEEATRICGVVLAEDPSNFDALHLSGLVKHRCGQPAEALRFIAAAMKARPGSADAMTNYGVILEALGRHQEALVAFDRALEAGADSANLHFNRGNVLNIIGRYADALASYDAALVLSSDHVDALYNRGNTLAALGRHADAVASYERAFLLAPERADIRANCGAELMALERNDEALACLDKALAVAPDHVVALNNRGNVLSRMHRFEEAFASYDKALALAPDYASALSNRGVALAELGRHNEALAHYARAISIAPDFIDAHLNRGNAFVAMARMEEGIRCYADVAALDPENPEANFNEAITRLCLGDFQNGLPKYEHRWRRAKYVAQRPNYPQPMWRGEQGISGKTIFLCSEQGIGDAIQFVRYAPMVAALGAKVILGAHGPLKSLLASVSGVAEVIADGEPLPNFDYYCPLLSLPLAFKTDLASIPSSVPYLRADAARVEQWRPKLRQTGRVRVGFCWAGSTAHVGDRRRSIPLEKFVPLLSVPGIDFFSLQKEVSDAQTAVLRECGIVALGEHFVDFSDTAAVVAQLDLVISVDTSVAHLAGAMAKAVAVLIPFAPDWRWMLHRTDTPWYPTMRLFRQNAVNNWEQPLARLRNELAGVASGRTASATMCG